MWHVSNKISLQSSNYNSVYIWAFLILYKFRYITSHYEEEVIFVMLTNFSSREE